MLLLAAGLWLHFDWATRGFTLEDAYITFRYAENLARGHGLVFNMDERVLGTSTPLLGVLLGGLGAIAGPERIPALAQALLLLASLGMGYFVYQLFRSAGLHWLLATLGMAFAVLHPAVAWVTAGGMETPLVLLFMAASLVFLQRGQWARLGASLGLLVLTRPDGLLWAGLLLLSTLLRGRAALRVLGAGAAVVLPWVLFAALYYGSPLPHSVLAKLAIPMRAEATRVDWSAMAHYAGLLAQNAGVEMRGRLLSMEFFEFALWTACLLAGAIRGLRQGPGSPFFVLVGFVPAFWLALSQSGLEAPFPWYGVPATWACAVLAGLGAATGIEWMVRTTRGRRFARLAASVFVVALALILGDRLLEDHEATRLHYQAVQAHADVVYKGVGLWLRDHASGGGTLATEAVGYQGYFSRLRVRDLAGLVSPEVVALAKNSDTHADLFRRTLTELKPDFVVLRAFEIEENVSFFGGPLFDTPMDRARFYESYELVQRFSHPHPWPRVDALVLFARR